MMIYIILSAILLYLYYRNRDLSVLMAFIVLVSSTLIFGKDVREGVKSGSGGGKIGNVCKTMGFTEVKLDDDPEGSLEKVFKNIKTVADKEWLYDGNASDEKKKSLNKFTTEFQNQLKTFDEDKRKTVDKFIMTSAEAYDKKRPKELLVQTPTDIASIISGGEITSKILKNINKTTEKDSDFKDAIKYLICLCNQWISIFKAIQTASSESKKKDD